MKTPTHSAVLSRVQVSYPRLHRILVPLDFSGKSRQALRYAVPLAHKFAARIVLVHVLDVRRSAAAPTDLLGATPAQREAAARRRLEATAQQLIPEKLRGTSVVLTGQPAAQILAALDRHDIDVLVLSTKGKSGLKRILVGSTAEKLMRQARCPVVSVRRT